MTGDLLLVHATVRTMDPARPAAAAVAVRSGRIACVGDEAGAREAAGAHADVLDCRGGAVLPGLVDSHLHFRWWAESLAAVDVGTPTREEAIERVRARASAGGSGSGRSGALAGHSADTGAGAWITGSGWDHNVWDRLPTKADLDRAGQGRPVSLKAKSGHALWASSAALGEAGIDRSTPDPVGGRIARDAAGEPTGILYENAMDLVLAVVPKPSPRELATAFADVQQRAWRAGLTGVHDFDSMLAFAAFQIMEESGRLGLRVLKGIPREELGEAVALGLRSGFGGAWLRLGQVKLFADGALGSRTAWMLEPFDGTSDRGMPTLTSEELRADIDRATQAGLACAVHAIGDAANRAVLDALEAVGGGAAAEGRSGAAAARGGASPRLPHRIEHAQLLHPDDVPRFARLGIVASMQPIHATSDIDIADRWWGARCATAYAWRSLLASGATLAFGSDCPVETPSPLAGIHAAVTRRRPNGEPGVEGWRAEQRLDVGEAVRGYTLGAAAAAGRELELGSIEVGKLGDLTVLAEDPFSVDANALRDLPVLATVTGGLVRFSGD